MCRIAFVVALAFLAPTARAVDFEADIRPIFQSCLSCHGPDKQRGGLRLDRKADALKGGDSGPAIVPRNSAESLVVRLVSGAEPDRLMPPKGERLRPAHIAALKAWIDDGAKWPDDGTTSANPFDWWSLRPLVRPDVPLGASHPIDAFIRAKLREKGFEPSPMADRRTLIRRLSFDLVGLPPSPEEVAAFVADDSTDAYERLVERLLASPAYGERWARHWLDVVHYGDTHGYDKDQPRPNAWPYRDYVIRSFNADKPYSRFVQEQVAGDVLFPGTRDGVTAMGFVAAGPWDFIGHAEVPESKIDGKIARHLDRDDMVATTINTFVSMTAQCAQCHNHKFDPISQEDYYRLQANFAALDRADRPFHADEASARLATELDQKKQQLSMRQRELAAIVSKAGGAELAELDRRIAAARQPKAAKPEFGYHSGIEPKDDRVKWVQIDMGRSVDIARVVLFGCHDDFNNIGDGFGFPVRFKVETSDDPAFAEGVAVVADRTAADVPNPGVAPMTFTVKGRGRFLRVTATKLAPRQNDFIFALAEVEAIDAAGKNVAAGAAVSSLDTIEAPVRWGRKNLTDGYAPGQSTELPTLINARKALIDRVVDVATARTVAEVSAELVRVEGERAKVRPVGVVYAGTVHNGSGAFRGTGPEGTPRTISVLRRGDVTKPGKVVDPGALAVIPGFIGDFAMPRDQTEGERRAALARWLSDSRNPLTWRSIVNRVWQYHFGRGIVATPSDFGKMGQLPSHPELLEWLAADFRDSGQSIKRLHRLIVTSETYRQSSASVPAFEKRDADNVYLWRKSRRKLEAEAIRDAVLAAGGKLDRTMGGPAFQDFVVEQPQHSPHYEYHLFHPDDPKSFRRSVYRFLTRSKPQPFMIALDCADPSMQVEKRTETLSPLQALALWNNGFMLVMSKHLAARSGNVTEAVRLALGRDPTPAEREALEAYAKEHGLAAACRVVLNLNEFVFVD